ncbi:MAG: OmpA family protein [Hydrogenophaga sp.]|uniref:OmpA family protein n=1 Tax=Hydrogenophaga sp. TaxID=1904254 RepID=UPI00271C5641|nr:OmpA family protein [Hydrogenophaga sp.]MDO9030035.1 OmpA family protein [Hydrogenophaga sp.]
MSLPSLGLRLLAPLLAATVLAACQTTPPPSAVYSGPVLPIQQAERGVEIFLPSAALFETGKSALNATEAGPYLDRIALLVTTKSDKAIALEGHADNVGSVELNQKLSDERAAEIGKALVARGVPTARIRTAGFASRRPVASNSTDEGRRLNRRVEVVLLEEKIENITRGEPAGAFASAWDQLKALIDQGLVKPVEEQ